MRTGFLKPAIVLLLLSSILHSCGCTKKKDCEGGTSLNFLFKLPFSYTPSTDTIKVGDTLWIESMFNSELLNEENGKVYALNDFKFGVFGSVNDLLTNPQVGYAGYTIIDTNGVTDNNAKNGADFFLEYIFSQKKYYWKRGIIFNKSSIYYIGIASSLGLRPLSNSGQSITKCGNEWVSIRSKRINGENNYYLVQDAADPNLRGQPKESFDGGILLYVKE